MCREEDECSSETQLQVLELTELAGLVVLRVASSILSGSRSQSYRLWLAQLALGDD